MRTYSAGNCQEQVVLQSCDTWTRLEDSNHRTAFELMQLVNVIVLLFVSWVH